MVTVNNAAELQAALASALPGDTIYLSSGNYGDVTINGAQFTNDVTLASADPAAPAIFQSLYIQESSHLQIDGVLIEHILEPGEPDWVSALRIDRSDHIEIRNSEFTGSVDGDYSNDGQGFLALDSTYVTLENNTFHDLKAGIGFGRSEHITVIDNDLFDIRSEGMNFGAVSHVLVEGNTLSDFHPLAGDHPDMIQFFNDGASQDMTDVVIRANDLSQGDGEAVQGIFIQGVPTGEIGTYPYSASGFVIDANTIHLGSAQGIWISDVSDVAITANTVTEVEGAELTPAIRTMRTTDAVVTDNTAPAIQDLDSVDLQVSGNTITGGTSSGYGTSGDDFIQGDAADNTLNGAAGNDELHGADGFDVLYGGGGNDRLFGEADDDSLFGDGGDDMLNGGAGSDALHGGDGNDGFFGGGGNDLIYGEAGNDTIYGDGGNDMLNGGGGADELHGGAGNDGFFAGGGNDKLFGEAGDDVLFADGGNDMLNGGAGHDELHGGSGNDGFFAGGGNDRLFGDAGDDTLYADGGNDTLSGGIGNDTLKGGAGSDTFIFDLDGGTDTVLDFSAAQGDVLQINAGSAMTVDEILGSAHQEGTTTILVLDPDTRIHLVDVTLDQLSAGDFWLL